MYALYDSHYRVTEQLTNRSVHSFCGDIASGPGKESEGLVPFGSVG